MNDDKKLPYDAVTGKELGPREQPGYYPGFSTMAQASYWDDATRKTTNKRLDEAPKIRFFDSAEAVLMEAMLARMLPQDDRTESAGSLFYRGSTRGLIETRSVAFGMSTCHRIRKHIA